MPRSCADERVLCNAGGYEYRVRRLRSGARMDAWTGPIFGLTVLTDAQLVRVSLGTTRHRVLQPCRPAGS